MIKKNLFLFMAGFFGASGVALGALGAHALRQNVKDGLMTPDQLAGFDTAAKYQVFHALALLILFYMHSNNPHKLFKIASWLFIIGVIFFSGSVYFLSTRNITGWNVVFLGPVTPLGGVCLIAGWICIMCIAFSWKKID